MLIQSANLAFTIVPDLCNREVQLILCHYFLPPCGNSTVFEPLTSVCEDICNYFHDLCPEIIKDVSNYLNQRYNQTLINCSNTGEGIEPLPHCCSDVGINIRKSLKS